MKKILLLLSLIASAITAGFSQADLLVNSLSVNPITVNNGANFSAAYTVTNAGSTAVSYALINFYMSADTILSANDKSLNSTYVFAIPANATMASATTSLTMNDSLFTGNYYLLANIDYNNLVAETNESNNVKYAQISVQTPNRDVSIVDFTGLSSIIYTTGQYKPSITLQTNGTVNMPSSKVGYYISQDTILSIGSDVLLGSTATSTLSASGNSNLNGDFILPNTIAVGNYYLLLVADYNNQIAETNENNNVKYKPVIIQQGVRDVFFESCYITSSITKPGANVTVTLRERNNGNITALARTYGFVFSTDTIRSANDYYYGSTLQISQDLLPANFYDQPVSTGIPYSIPAGNYYLIVTTDVNNNVTESNENNNNIYIPITIYPTDVDLWMKDIQLSSTIIKGGETFTAKAKVVNIGTGDILSNTNATVYTNYYYSTDTIYQNTDGYLGVTNTFTSLNANTAFNSTIQTLTLPNIGPGTGYILAITDFQSSINEISETNNLKYLAITIPAVTYDLQVQSTTLPITVVKAISGINIPFNIINTGTGTASVSANVDVLESMTSTTDLAYTYNNTLSLTSGASGTLTTYMAVLSAIPDGNYFIKITLDPSNTLAETDETNNVRFFPITILSTGNPDLTVTSASSNITTVSLNTPITIMGTIKNIGTVGNTTSNYSYIYYSKDSLISTTTDNVLITSITGTNLDVNQSENFLKEIAIPYSATVGTGYILVQTDASAGVAESNETNNVKAIALNVVATTYDYLLSNQTLSKSTVSKSEPISFSAKVENISTASLANFYLYTFLSTDTVYSSATDISLGSAYPTNNTMLPATFQTLSATLTMPSNTANGNYYILFVGDPNGYITEVNETNNVKYLPITVVNASYDFVVNSIIAPSTIIRNTNTAISSNLGQLAGTNVATNLASIGYYLSSDNVLNTNTDALVAQSSFGAIAGNSAIDLPSVTINTTLTAGNYYLFAYADRTLSVTETNEANNTLSIPIIIINQQLDLKAEALEVPYPSTIPGSRLSLKGKIKNQGNATISSSISYGFYLSADTLYQNTDVQLLASSITSLMKDSIFSIENNVQVPNTVSPGTYYVLLFADRSQSITETLETNNINYFLVTIGGGSLDILAMELKTVGDSLPINVATSVYTKITNSTILPIPTLFNNAIYLSTDSAFSISTDVLLGNYSSSFANGYESIGNTSSITIPNGTSAGTKYLIFVADRNAIISEGDETNNIIIKKIQVVPAKKDLSFTGFTISESLVVRGTALTSVTGVEKNAGNATAETHTMAYFLSTDSIYQASDVYLSQFSMSGLTNGNTFSFTHSNLTIPVNTTPGNYYLIAFVDYNNNVLETNEANNYTFKPITVSLPNIDLVTQTFTIPQNIGVAGVSITATSSTRNIGTTPVTGYIYQGFYLSTDTIFSTANDIQLNTSYIYSLAGQTTTASANTTLTIPSNQATGNYYLLSVADYTISIAETNETNNVKYLPFTIQASTKDLYFTAFSSTTPTVAAPSTATISFVVANAGNTVASNNYVGFALSTDTIYSSASDIYLNYNSSATSIVANGSQTVTNATLAIPANTALGNYYLFAIADYYAYNAETSETNNTKFVAISIVAPNIDLQPIAYANLQDTVVKNQVATFNLAVKNNGTVVANANTSAFFLSTDSIYSNTTDVLLTSATVQSIAAGITSTQAFSFTMPTSVVAGDYYLLSVIDYSSAINEVNETNNVLSKKVTVINSNIDLTITNVSFSNTGLIYPTTTINIVGTEKNIGNTTILGHYMYFYSSTDSILNTGTDQVLGNYYSGALARNSEFIQSFNTTIATVGTHYIFAVADASSGIAESNETNNNKFVKIVITAPDTDLKFNSVTVSNVWTKTTNTAYAAQITNAGTYASAGFYTYVYLSLDTVFNTSTDTYLGYVYDAGLTAGAVRNISTSFTVPNSVADGQYYLLSKVDANATVLETNENNNVQVTAVYVGNPSIDLKSTISTTATSIVTGTTFPISATTSNIGITPASNVGTTYYLSLDTVYSSATDIQLAASVSPSIAGSSSSSYSAAVLVPATTAPNTYYVLAVADRNGFITETNEANNVGYTPTTIAITPQDIDLKVLSIEPVYSKAGFGNFIVFNMKIKNTGTVNAGAFNMKIYLSSDQTIGAGDTLVYNTSAQSGGLAAGDSIYYANNTVWAATSVAGNYYLILVIDTDDKVFETNETNNSKTFTQSIYISNPTIDLVVDKYILTPNSLKPSKNTVVKTTLKNVGNAFVYGNDQHFVSYYLSTDTILSANDTLVGGHIPRINVGYIEHARDSLIATSITIPATNRAPGNYFLLTKVDNFNTIVESNETNNVHVQPFTILQPALDFTLPSYYISGDSITTTMAVKPSVSLRNNGTDSVPSLEVRYYLSADTLLGNSDVFLGGRSTSNPINGITQINDLASTLSLPINVTPGKYFLLAKVDGSNSYYETNENNNIRYAKLTIVATTKDFYLSSITVQNNNTLFGGNISAEVTVFNLGNTVATTNNYKIYLSQDSIYQAGTDTLLYVANFINGQGLAAQTSNTSQVIINMPLSVIPNKYYLIAFVDRDSLVTETNEANNTNFVRIQVLADDIDLRPIATTFVGDTIVENRPYSFNTTIKNFGTDDSPLSHTKLYISQDSIWDKASDILLTSGAVSAILAASTQHISFSTMLARSLDSLPAGSYYILTVADADSEVDELYENNNVLKIKVYMQKAVYDIALTSVHTIDTIMASETIDANIILSNIGNNNMYGMLKYYISTDNELSTSTDILIHQSSAATINYQSAQNFTNSLTIPRQLTTGNYYLLTYFENTTSYTEASVSNNLYVTPIHVLTDTSNIDLKVNSMLIPAIAYLSGDDINVSINVRNFGTYNNFQHTNIRLVISSDTLYDASDIEIKNSSLAYTSNDGLGTTMPLISHLPDNITAGEYFIIAYVDEHKIVSETNELNNVLYAPITISVATDVADIFTDRVEVYPNPFPESIKISLSSNKIGKSLWITDMNGVLVYDKVITQNEDLIDLSFLPTGVFLVNIDENMVKITKE